MSDWLTLAWIALAVSGFAFILFNRVWLEPVRRRQAAALDPEYVPEPVLGGWTEAWAGQLPMTASGRADIQGELRAAGYYRRTALTEYAAVRALLVVVPLILTGVAVVVLPEDRLPTVLAAGGCATLLGFSLPRVYVAARRRGRDRQIARGLPLAIDLLTLCLSAGQNILTALEQARAELTKSFPALAEELAIVEQQARLHSLEYALQQLAQRVSVPDLRNVTLLLIQSERLGTDTAATLQEYAANMRTTFRQRAEAQAGRASFWMLFPSVFCLFVAAAIVLIGPTYLEFWRFRSETTNLLEQGRSGINSVNSRPGAAPAQPAAPPSETVR
jgi:tight adherence protein C